MFTKTFALFLILSCKCLLWPHYIALKHICWRIFQKRKWSCRHYFSTQWHRYIGGCHLGPLIKILQHFLTLPLERQTNDYFHCRLIWWLSSWVIDEWFGKNRRTRSPYGGLYRKIQVISHWAYINHPRCSHKFNCWLIQRRCVRL